MTSPVVLVLDDLHVLHNQECLAALSVLADHVPGGSRHLLTYAIPHLAVQSRIELARVHLALADPAGPGR